MIRSVISYFKRIIRNDLKIQTTITPPPGSKSQEVTLTGKRSIIKPHQWYMVVITINTENKKNVSLQLILNPEKPTPTHIDLEVCSNITKKRLFFSSAFSKKIHITSTDDNFNILDLKIFKASRYFAYSRALKKLTNNHPRYLHQKKWNIANKLIKEHLKSKYRFSKILYNSYIEVTDTAKTNKDKDYYSWIQKNENEKGIFYPISISSAIIIKNPISTKKVSRKYKSIKNFKKLQRELNLLSINRYTIIKEESTQLSDIGLNAISKAIQNNPNAQLIYGDEDRIDARNHRHTPNFKPDWNQDLFYSSNYIGENYIINNNLLSSGLNNPSCTSETQRENILKAINNIQKEDITHIPKIIFHRRSDYTKTKNINRIIYPIPKNKPLVSIIIPTKDNLSILQRCINSILDKTTYKNYEIIIINNNSKQNSSKKYFKEICTIKNISILDFEKPFNFSAINNFAAKSARGEYLLLLNNDTEVISRDWIEELLRHATHPEVGCVGAKLLYSDNTIQHAGVILGINGAAGHAFRGASLQSSGYFNRLSLVQNYSAVTAACLMVSKKIYLQVGGLSEHLAITMNDVDFCLKVREIGYRNIWTPHALLYHHESQSRGEVSEGKNRKDINKEVMYLKKRWATLIARDPSYNINLTRIKEDFSVNPFRCW